jgi:preprotein translocase SecF subunit
MYNFFAKQESAYGIDFAGGQIQEYQFQTPVSSDTVRDILKSINQDDAIIQKFEKYPNNVMIRTVGDSYDQVSEALKNQLPKNPYETLRIEKVGPVVGKALRNRALLAIIFALGGILIYVGFRFKHFDFATAGVIALLHDIIVTVGLLMFFNRQIDLLVVTALLTIAGYSINDTIIIYDRVRENMAKSHRMPLVDTINLSVNQTLGRTILTTITTLMVVISLYMFGGEVLNTFALTLLIGFITGTYSTVFIASPLVLMIQKKTK